MNIHRIKRTTRISSSFPQLILRITLLSLAHKLHLAVAITAVICGAFFQLMIPGLLGKAVDQSVKVFESSQAGVEQLYWTALLLFLVSAIRGLFAFTHTFVGEAIGQNIGYLLRIKYFEKLQKLSFSLHDRVHTGDLCDRHNDDVSTAKNKKKGNL